MSQNQNNQRKEGLYTHPLAHVILFLIAIAAGAIIGVMLKKPLLGLTVGLVLGVSAGTIAGTCLENNKWFYVTQTSNRDILEKHGVYIDGKMKRYSLLFGVNGGAFAIVQLMTDQTRQLPGKLTLPSLAAGAVVFTAVMTVDIWLWGQRMRQDEFAGLDAFTWVGKVTLLLIGGLIISGWVLAGLPS